MPNKKKFTKDDYPDSWKNMHAEVRYKAIEVANSLFEDENYEEGRVIAIATSQAKEWAENRDKEVFKDNT